MTVIRVTMPEEVAAALADIEGVDVSQARRSGWLLASDVLTGATTTLALLQAPQTISDIAGRVHGLFAKRKRDAGSIVVEAKGPHGQLRIKFTDGTDVAEIEKLLRGTIFEAED